jgi:hypothetical protein
VRWTAALVAAGAVAATAPAVARAATVTDGNDSRGALDVRSVTAQHDAIGPVTHTITMYDPWRSRLLGIHRESAIFIGFDVAGGPRIDRFAEVFFYRGKLRVDVFTRAGRFLGTGTVTRLSRRSIAVQIRRRLLGRPAGYRWSVVTLLSTRTGPCRSGCVDSAPNRGTAVHDLTPPAISFPAPPDPASTTTAVHFTVSDTGGSRLGLWALQMNDGGPLGWQTVAQGSKQGAHDIPLTRAQGDAISLRVIARDRFGNTTTSTERSMVFPYDDANASAMSFTGTWASAGGPSDYQGTLHTSADTSTPATVSVTFDGRSVALIGPGSCGTGTVTIDAASAGSITEPCDSGHRETVFSVGGLAAGHHTLVVTVTGATFGIDGAIVR